MISISDLDFHYPSGAFRLAIAGLEIAPRERVAVVGPSGSGKTTLLHLLAGVVVPQSGRVEVDGIEVSRLGDAARRSFRIRRVGQVFQDFELIEYLNVRENILLPYAIHRGMRLDDAVRARARALADSVGLGQKLARPVLKLSHGEKQRVAICRALLPGPSLLLADEPTGNLDPAGKRRIVDLLFAEAARASATLIVVTHDQGILAGFNRVIDFDSLLG